MNGLRTRPVLANAFVGTVNKRLIFSKRGASGSPELHAAKRRNCASGIEIVFRVKNFVSIKQESRSVEFVNAALRNRVNYRSGGATVFRRVVAGQYGKFLNPVHSKIQARRTTWGAVRIIVYADSVDPIRVFICTMSAIAQLIPEPAIAFVRAETGPNLIRYAGNSRLERCQRRPIATIQRKFPHRRGVHRRAYCRCRGLHVGRRRGYLNGLIERTDLQTDIQGLLRADVQRN